MTVSTDQLQMLYTQIQQIQQSFRLLRGEAENILEKSEMPDSQLQLGDVLNSTETATMAIINHAAAINGIVSEGAIPDSQREEVQQHISQIFEACSFQDISGQRIKKVMQRLQALEEQLGRLGDFARTDSMTSKPVDPLLNGPQLQSHAPDQAAADQLFNEC